MRVAFIRRGECVPKRCGSKPTLASQTAIRLSRGSDTANIIANAAVSACDGEAIKEASEVSGKDGRPEKVLADIRYTMMRSALVAINNGAEGTMF